jgi:hypothetical protein
MYAQVSRKFAKYDGFPSQQVVNGIGTISSCDLVMEYNHWASYLA